MSEYVVHLSAEKEVNECIGRLGGPAENAAGEILRILKDINEGGLSLERFHKAISPTCDFYPIVSKNEKFLSVISVCEGVVELKVFMEFFGPQDYSIAEASALER